LLPSSIEELKDGNNRAYIPLDDSGDGIEDLKNLKFPEFIKKDKIMY
jgi:hypothetical protein